VLLAKLDAAGLGGLRAALRQLTAVVRSALET
jgi:hypothetical protein